MLIFSKHTYDLGGSASTVYFSPIHIEEQGTENWEVVGVMPVACTMSTMTIRVGSGMEGGVTATFTLRKGATLAAMADTALACGVTAAAPFCSDTAAVAMSAGDLISFRLNYNAGSTGGADVFLTNLICE
jgi:hypothetical protein